jgi:hypothetical protein
MGSSESKVDVVSQVYEYADGNFWTKEMKSYLANCVTEIEKMIATNNSYVHISENCERDKSFQVHEAIMNYYANERGYNIMFDNGTIYVIKFDLISESYLLNHKVPEKNAPYAEGLKHVCAKFVVDFLPIVEKWMKQDQASVLLQRSIDISNHPFMMWDKNMTIALLSVAQIINKRHENIDNVRVIYRHRRGLELTVKKNVDVCSDRVFLIRDTMISGIVK